MIACKAVKNLTPLFQRPFLRAQKTQIISSIYLCQARGMKHAYVIA